jgi:hypothetical protein
MAPRFQVPLTFWPRFAVAQKISTLWVSRSRVSGQVLSYIIETVRPLHAPIGFCAARVDAASERGGRTPYQRLLDRVRVLQAIGVEHLLGIMLVEHGNRLFEVGKKGWFSSTPKRFRPTCQLPLLYHRDNRLMHQIGGLYCLSPSLKIAVGTLQIADGEVAKVDPVYEVAFRGPPPTFEHGTSKTIGSAVSAFRPVSQGLPSFPQHIRRYVATRERCYVRPTWPRRWIDAADADVFRPEREASFNPFAAPTPKHSMKIPRTNKRLSHVIRVDPAGLALRQRSPKGAKGSGRPSSRRRMERSWRIGNCRATRA